MTGTKYRIYCDGRGTHRLRTLGVLNDARKPGEIDSDAMAERVKLLDALSGRDKQHTDDEINDLVRNAGKASRGITYRNSHRRLTAAGEWAEHRNDSIEVRVTNQGREFYVICRTCLKQRRVSGPTRLSEQQVNEIVDGLQAKRAELRAEGCLKLPGAELSRWPDWRVIAPDT